MSRILVDGVPGDVVTADDRGLAYGDGVFETMAFRDGGILAWPRHLERLRRGCEVLGMSAPDGATLHEECLAAGGSEECVIKLVITRGSGGRGYRPPAPARVRRLVFAHPWPEQATAVAGESVRVWICAHPLGINPRTAGIKHLNRLDQVIASAEWPGEGYFEGLMLDPDGRLIEGTRSNLFVVRDGAVLTPWLGRCGVLGVVRQAAIERLRRMGTAVEETDLVPGVLRHAEEVFLTNSIVGVRPVTEIEGPDVVTLEPGPVARALAAALREAGVIP